MTSYYVSLTSGGTSSSTSTAWHTWTTDSTATTTCDLTWATWANDTTASITFPASNVYPAYQQMPAEELDDAARELRAGYEAERAARDVAARYARAEAEAKAEALLLDNLDEAQARDYRERKHVIVVGGYSGTRYRLRISRTGNIDVIDTQGRVSHRLCAHPREDMPDCDVVLVQKLMLEADEQAFLKVANRHASFDRNARVLPPL